MALDAQQIGELLYNEREMIIQDLTDGKGSAEILGTGVTMIGPQRTDVTYKRNGVTYELELRVVDEGSSG